MRLVTLDCANNGLVDLSPLCGVPLERLNVSNSERLKDLTPLTGMRLWALDVGGTGVTDVSVLGTLTELRFLSIRDTRGVSDLSPAKCLWLDGLVMGNTQVMGPDAAPGDAAALPELRQQSRRRPLASGRRWCVDSTSSRFHRCTPGSCAS